MSPSDDETPAVFQPLLDRLQQNQMAAWASAARQRHVEDEDAIACTVLEPPLFGSYHILFVLVYEDGVRWLLKIPATGYREVWDTPSAEALRSEALTMRLIRRTTTIPVPEVYAFSDSIDPQLGCAYILMGHMDGVPVHEVWFDQSLAPAALDQVRKRVLTELAAAMQQLGQHSFGRGGAPRYDDSGALTDVGALKIPNLYAVLDAMVAHEYDDLALPVCGVGPFVDPRDYFRCMLHRRRVETSPLGQGVDQLLELIIGWMPGPKSGQVGADAPFVLAHPDLDMQNILVGSDGALKAIIDWDRVAALPRCVGNERYPIWLTRDWDTRKYEYDADDPTANCHENSPEELDRYRVWYTTQMKKAGASGDHTTRSLLWANVEIAAVDPFSTLEIILKVVDELLEAQALENGHRLYCYDIACNLAEGKGDGSELRTLRAAFRPWGDVRVARARFFERTLKRFFPRLNAV
ncbi:MAG: hypothetical protein M1826_002553 [Phylliscum demangeonii]|nr:MAG: hypothetical protein M1826_002553 [Phylliscum demangeonii]